MAKHRLRVRHCNSGHWSDIICTLGDLSVVQRTAMCGTTALLSISLVPKNITLLMQILENWRYQKCTSSYFWKIALGLFKKKKNCYICIRRYLLMNLPRIYSNFQSDKTVGREWPSRSYSYILYGYRLGQVGHFCIESD